LAVVVKEILPIQQVVLGIRTVGVGRAVYLARDVLIVRVAQARQALLFLNGD